MIHYVKHHVTHHVTHNKHGYDVIGLDYDIIDDIIDLDPGLK